MFVNFMLHKTFANFKPLIDRDYGTEAWKSRVAGGKSAMRRPEASAEEIPIKPLDINLFTLGQIMNAMQ